MVEHDHEMPPGCAVARDEFSALLDDELPPGLRNDVEAHLAECADCLRALDGMKKVNDLYAALPRVGAPEDFEAKVRRAVRPSLLRFPGGRRGALAMLAAAATVAFTAPAYLWLQHRGTPEPAQMAMNAEMRSAAPAAMMKSAPESDDAGALAASGPQAGSAQSAPAEPDVHEEAEEKTLSLMAAPAVEPVAEATASVEDTHLIWHAANRVFTLKDNVWIEQTEPALENEAEANIIELTFDSAEFKQLSGQFPELLELDAVTQPVVFRTGDNKWYRLLPKTN